ncbi:MAG: metal-dependent hydrolase, partial [Verrucomicrobiales bacterium]|nr:metal-dependent hydrolase [Verrucomicrobiales bacterium]
MFVVTHALSPVVLVGLVDVVVLESRRQRWLRRRQYVGVAVAGSLPDVFWPHLSLAARMSSPTHTVWFLMVVAVVAAVWAGRFVDPNRRWLMAGLMTAACGWHLFCDAIAGGIKWGYPVFEHVVARRWVPYPTWLFLDLACVVLVGGIAGWLRWRETPTRRPSPPLWSSSRRWRLHPIQWHRAAGPNCTGSRGSPPLPCQRLFRESFAPTTGRRTTRTARRTRARTTTRLRWSALMPPALGPLWAVAASSPAPGAPASVTS